MRYALKKNIEVIFVDGEDDVMSYGKAMSRIILENLVKIGYQLFFPCVIVFDKDDQKVSMVFTQEQFDTFFKAVKCQEDRFTAGNLEYAFWAGFRCNKGLKEAVFKFEDVYNDILEDKC